MVRQAFAQRAGQVHRSGGIAVYAQRVHLEHERGPVSGLNLVSHPLLRGNDFGPEWLTGGNYGIEGGIAGTIAMVLATIFTWRTGLVSATPELKKLTSEENPVVTSPVVTIRPADDAA